MMGELSHLGLSGAKVMEKIAEARVPGPSGSRVALLGLLFPLQLAKLITRVFIQCTHLGHVPQTTADLGNTFLSLYDTALPHLVVYHSLEYKPRGTRESSPILFVLLRDTTLSPPNVSVSFLLSTRGS